MLPRRERYKTIPIVGMLLAIARCWRWRGGRTGMTLLEFEALLFLIGSASAACRRLSATALQNNVSIHTFGSAVATMQFSRNLFATIMVAVFGVLVLAGAGRCRRGTANIRSRASSACSWRWRRALRSR